jgi:D-xylose transport system substrate-binding protein
MHIRRSTAFALSAASVLAVGAFSPIASATTVPPGTEGAESGGGGDCVVGVSWNNFQEPRWAAWDEPALQGAIEAEGGTYISTDAQSSAETQLSDVENLISQGANVLVILAQDGTAILPAVATALDNGIPVIAYDRLIDDPGVLYMTFDNVGVGRTIAEVIYDLVPTGNYVIIKGNAADANADFLRAGMEEVIGDAVEAGDITIVGESYTDNWDPAIAQTNMEQFLTDANNDVQAVLSENDSMAGGVVAALEAQGLAGQVPVGGQDGDLPALNRVALGTQTVSVWKDSRILGQAAGEAALELCANPDLASVTGTAPFTSPGGNELTSIFFDPQAITRDNLDVVLEAGVIDQATLCQGVEAGTVAVCDESAGSAPAGSEPMGTEPAGTEPAGTESMGTDPATTGG